MRTKRWILGIAAGLGTVAIIAAALFGFAQTSVGRAVATKLGTAYLAAKLGPGQTVTAGKIEGLLPFTLRLDTLTIADAQGPWLTAKDIEVQCEPFEIIFRRYHFYSLTAASVTLDHYPRRPATETTGTSFLAEHKLPNVRIDSFALPSVTLGPGIYPWPITLAVRGNADSERSPSKFAVDAQAKNTSGPELNARAAVVLTDNPYTLNVDIDYKEAPRGLFAHTIGLNTAQPLSIVISGQGPLTDWRGSFRAQTGNAVFAQANIVMAGEEELSIQINGEAQSPAGMLPPRLEPLFQSRTTIEAAARYRARQLVIDRLAVAAPWMNLTSAGTLDSAENKSDARFHLDVKDLSLLEPVLGVGLGGQSTFEGTITGPILMPVIQTSLTAKSVRAAKAHADEISGALRFTFLSPLTMRPPKVQGAGNATVTNLVYEGAPSLPDKNLRLDFAAETRPPNSIAVTKLDVENPAFKAAVSGVIDYTTRLADLTAHISTSNMSYLAGIVGSPMQGAAEVSAHLEADARRRVASGAFTGECSRLSGLPPYVEALSGTHVSLAGNLQYDKDGDVKVTGLDVNAEDAHVTGAAAYGASDKSVDATFDVSVPRLANLSAVAKRPMTGSLSAQTHVTGTLDALSFSARATGKDMAVAAAEGEPLFKKGGNLNLEISGRADVPAGQCDAKFTGDLSKFTGAKEYVDALLGKRVAFRGNAAWTAGKKAEVRPLRITSERVSAEGNASFELETKTLQSKWQVSLPDLSALSHTVHHPMSGALSLTGQMAGTFPNVKLALEGKGKNVKVEGYPVNLMTATIGARNLFHNPKGDMRLALDWKNDPVKAQFDFTVKSPILEVTGLRVSGPGLNATGNATAHFDTKLTDGKVTGDARDLSWIGGLLNDKMAGSAKFNLRLAAEHGRQNATLTIEAGNVVSPWGKLASARATASANDLFSTLKGNATITARGFKHAGLAVDHFAAHLDGALKGGTFKSEADGSHERPFRFATNGAWSYDNHALSVTLQDLQGKYADVPVALDAPLDVQEQGGQYTIKPVSVSIGSGKVTAGAQLTQGRVEATVAVDSIPLQLAHLFGGPDASGEVDGRLRVAGPPDQPEVDAALSLKKVAFRGEQYAGAPETAVTANARVKDNAVTAKCEVAGIFKKPIQATATLPLRFSLQPFSLNLPQDGPIHAAVVFDGNLNALNRIPMFGQRRIEGEIKGNIQCAGTLAAPALSGEASVSNGQFQDYTTGTILKNADVTLTGKGTRFELAQVAATDGGNGRVTATGWIDLNTDRGCPVEISLTMEKATLLRRDDVTAAFGGALNIKGALERTLDVSGTLTVTPVEAAIAERNAQEQLTGLDIVEVNKPGQKPGRAPREPAQQKKGKSGSGPVFPKPGPLEPLVIMKAPSHSDPVLEKPGHFGKTGQLSVHALIDNPFAQRIQLNVKADLPRKLFVRGYGLDSEWKGALNAAGNLERPLITGRIQLVRGQLAFLGRPFTLTDGTVSFPAAAFPPKPTVDITAEAKATDVTAQVRITGDVTKPEMHLESTPPLPEDEILSRVLFGRELAKISPLQAVQIASAANALAGGPKALNIFDTTRQLLGIDELTLVNSGDKTASTAIGIGKYLGKNVHVNVEQGLGSQNTKANVEIEVAPNLSVGSSVGEKGEGIEFGWKKDY